MRSELLLGLPEQYAAERLTSSASLFAMRSIGMRKRAKKTESMAKPFAARVCRYINEPRFVDTGSRMVLSYNYSVIPGKDCKLIQAGDEIPAGSDITS